MKLPLCKGGDITEAVGSVRSALEVNKEMTTTTTDTRDNLNVRPGIKFEQGRAEVWGYSQIDMRDRKTTTICVRSSQK